MGVAVMRTMPVVSILFMAPPPSVGPRDCGCWSDTVFVVDDAAPASAASNCPCRKRRSISWRRRLGLLGAPGTAAASTTDGAGSAAAAAVATGTAVAGTGLGRVTGGATLGATVVRAVVVGRGKDAEEVRVESSATTTVAAASP